MDTSLAQFSDPPSSARGLWACCVGIQVEGGSSGGEVSDEVSDDEC